MRESTAAIIGDGPSDAVSVLIGLRNRFVVERCPKVRNVGRD